MLRKITAFIFLLCFPGAASATCTTGSSGKCEVGSGKTYSTISSCISAFGGATNQHCLVFAGTYTENVTIPAGGVGAYNTVETNASDIITVNGEFTINSHTKVIGNCPFNTSIGNCGFSIQNTSSPGTLCINGTTNMTDYSVKGVSMYACGGIVTGANGSNSSNGYFGYITFAYSCSTSVAPNVCTAGQIRGDNILLEYIATSHVSDGFYFAGAHITYRDSLFGPTVDTDCGSNSSNCHIDFMQADANQAGGARPVQYLLLERNTIQSMTTTGTGDAHAIGLFQAESCSTCFNGIVRYNVENGVANGGIIDDNSGAAPPAWDNVSSYNNSLYDVDHADASTNGSGTDGYTHGSTGAMSVNNIYYYPQSSMPGFNPYYCDGGGVATCSTMTYGNNLAFCSSCGSTTHSSVPVSMSGANATFTGSFTFSAGSQFWVSGCSLSAYNGLPWTTASGGSGANIVATSPGVTGLASAAGCTLISYGGTMFFHTYGGSTLFAGDSGNLVVDPKFVTNGSNFNLQSTSPARNAGRALTTANGSGSSTSLVVHNANPFQDGGGTTGVQGDCIKVSSWSNPCVGITAVNYSTKTLTLASSITWSDGDSVWLASLSDGTNVATDTTGPDIGANQFAPVAQSAPIFLFRTQ